MAPAGAAEVRLHGRRVGELRFLRGGSEFRYEDDLSSPEHLVLGQIFEDDPGALRRARVGLPAWFSNLLPEGALRRQIIRELGGGNIGDFTLLLRVGSNLPGAVTVHSEDEPEDDLLPPGDELRDLPLNEYLTMRWLAAAGYPVPAVHLVRANAVKGLPDGLVDADELVYVIQRFDRTAAGRLHVEDFAQVADVEPMFKYSESGASYDTLAAAVRQLTGDAGYDDFIRRLVAMVVVGNTDAHLKNWAVIYPDGRTPQLAPVYDFHSLSLYSHYRWAPLALSLDAESVPPALTPDHFRRLADRADADPDRTVEVIAEAVAQLREAWTTAVAAEARSRHRALADHYTGRLDTLALCRSVG